MLSKKYYKKFAEILGKENTTEQTIKAFASFFRSDNWRFSEGKFREAISKARDETL